jgi:hypothetical protein
MGWRRSTSTWVFDRTVTAHQTPTSHQSPVQLLMALPVSPDRHGHGEKLKPASGKASETHRKFIGKLSAVLSKN